MIFRHLIKLCPVDWRKTIYLSGVLTVFQEQPICPDAWKNKEKKYNNKSKVALQSWGQCPTN